MFASKDALFAKSSAAYQISRSLRFRSSASAYLNRTPASATNRTVWTWSAWVKRGSLPGTYYSLFAAFVDGSNVSGIGFNTSNQIEVYNYVTTYQSRLVTNAVYRDPSAWYHIVVSSNGSTSLNLYVNGVQVTSFSTTVGPAATNWFFNSTNQHQLGTSTAGGTTYYFDGYMSEVNFIDGSALTPSSFGAFDTNGVWQPAKYTGSYGTNGFYLNFSDNSGATSTTIGKDSSGNGNNWTPNNISVTSGTTYDSMIDSPTNYADTGNGRGNYAVLNSAAPANGLAISQANLYLTGSGTAGWRKAASTIAVSSGKWYFEVTFTNLATNGYLLPGIESLAASLNNASGQYYGSVTDSYGYFSNTGQKYTNTVASAYGASYTTNDVIGVAVDLTNGAIYFGKQTGGTGSIVWQNSGDPTSGSSKTGAAFTFSTGLSYVMGCSAYQSEQAAINFGQRPFSATIPSGYSAVNTQNLSTPTISNGAQYMAAVLYNGTSASNTVTATTTNSGNNPLPTTFQPDLVWIKSRSAATDHKLTDVVRGVTKALISNTTGAETTDTNGLTAFTTSGFTVGSDSNYNNGTGPATYVAWEWKAGGTGSAGSGSGLTNITNSANASAGFSITTYTGNGSAGAYFNHGIGAAPNLVIVKQRTASSTTNWAVWHISIANTNYLLLNTSAISTSGTTYWNSTTPDSTKVTLGTAADVNTNTGTYVAYCFAPIAGYSAFGSYTGNASADGPFVYTGFRPRFVLVKNTSATGEWSVFDTSRSSSNGANVEDYKLYPSTSNTENGVSGETTSTNNIDTLSNGFKLRTANGNTNGSTNVFIYAAFAENPFKISRAR